MKPDDFYVALGLVINLSITKSIIVEAIEKTTAPKKAGIIPLISKPLTKSAASAKVIVFITSANKPKVIIVIGKEKNLIIGRIKVFTITKTKVAINKVLRSETDTAETMFAVNKSAIAFPINDIKYRIILFYYNSLFFSSNFFALLLPALLTNVDVNATIIPIPIRT